MKTGESNLSGYFCSFKMQQGKWSNIKLLKLFFLYTKDIDVLLRLNKPTVFQIIIDLKNTQK